MLIEFELANRTNMSATGCSNTDPNVGLLFANDPGNQRFEQLLVGSILDEEIDQHVVTHQ